MLYSPKKHQEIIFDHVSSRPVSLILAGMGLGKTVTTLDVVDHFITGGEATSALIVAPLRVCNLTWVNEVEKWAQFRWLKVANLRTPEGKRAWKNKSADIYLINYEQLQQFSRDFLKGKQELPADMVVWDEISKAKNPSSKRINAFRAHRHKFKFHIGLTGTPTPNSYLDLFAQVRLLDGGARLGTAFTKFRSKYFDSDYMGYSWTLKEGARELIEAKIADITITLRSEDWLDIPETTVEDHTVTLPKEIKSQYKELEKELLLQMQDSVVVAVNAAVLAGKLLQLTGGCMYDEHGDSHIVHDLKLKKLIQIHKQVKAPKLVLYNYKHERDQILKHIPDAEQFDESRLEAWDRGEIPMWVANGLSIGHGLNLQAGASDLVWFSPTYSRELYDQTNARLARQGQEKRTTIHRILCPDTVDDAVVEALRQKGSSQSGFLDAMKNLQTLRK